MTPELTQAVADLEAVLDKLVSASDKNFATSLVAYFHKHGTLSSKQALWVGKLTARAEGPVVAPKPVFSPSITNPPVPVNVGDFAGVIALFNKAKEHLKFPKITLLVDGVKNGPKVTLALNSDKAKYPGYVSILGPHKNLYGRVSPEGVLTVWTNEEFKKKLIPVLEAFSANPARIAKEHGKLTGHCCFCRKELGLGEDQRSVLVGYGPVCAEHYGLKDKWLAAASKAEVKASVAPTVTLQTEDGVAVKVPQTDFTDSLNSTVATNSTGATVVLNPYPADEQVIGVLNFKPLVESATATAESLKKVSETILTTAAVTSPIIKSLIEKAAAEEEAKIKLEKFQEATASMDYLGGDYPVSEEFKDKPVIEHYTTESTGMPETPNGAVLLPLSVTCFFCEEDCSANYASKEGYIVCPTCLSQLN